MDFEPSHWLEILRNNPVLVVMLGGLVGGNAITQTVKLTYLAWFKVAAVDMDRYRVSVMWLAVLTTFLLTNRLWEAFIGGKDTGLRHVAGLIVALASPWVYRVVKAGVAWKWPDFAAKWGDHPE